MQGSNRTHSPGLFLLPYRLDGLYAPLLVWVLPLESNLAGLSVCYSNATYVELCNMYLWLCMSVCVCVCSTHSWVGNRPHKQVIRSTERIQCSVKVHDKKSHVSRNPSRRFVWPSNCRLTYNSIYGTKLYGGYDFIINLNWASLELIKIYLGFPCTRVRMLFACTPPPDMLQ